MLQLGAHWYNYGGEMEPVGDGVWRLGETRGNLEIIKCLRRLFVP